TSWRSSPAGPARWPRWAGHWCWGSRPASQAGAAAAVRWPCRDLEGAPQRRGERFGVARLFVGTTVDEESRRAGHAALDTARDVLFHPGGVHVGVELASHPLGVEPQLTRVPDQLLVPDPRLPLVQP